MPVLILLALGCQSDSDLSRVHEAPDVTLLAPLLGEVLRVGEGPFVAKATVADSFTPVTDLQLTWTLDDVAATGESDATGALAYAMPLAYSDIGPHTLTLRAVDEDGDNATASVEFSLFGPREAPVVTISAPQDGTGFEPLDSITFQGNATDSATAAAELLLAWDVDGILLEGSVTAEGVSVVIATLPVGSHTVTLTATDTDGDVGTDAISIAVTDEPVPAQPGDLVFSELMIDPQVVDDTLGEWVELYNTSGSSIDIGGYTFRDDDVDAYELQGSIVVAPNDFVVLCADMSAAQNGGVPCDAGFQRDSAGSGMALANGPDEVVLARPDGVEIDWLHYDETWYTLAIAIGVDPEYQDAGNNDDKMHWCNQVSVVSTGGEPGTPGQANDGCE